MLVLVSARASAWDNADTHREVTRAALSRASSDGALDRYFQESLGLSSIGVEALPLVREFDGLVDADIGSSAQDPDDGSDLSRLNCTLNLFPDGICDGNRLVAEDRVRMSQPDCTGQGCAKYSISRLVRVGSYAEDNPNPRASHHFFDPTREGVEQGLDNRTEWLVGLDVMLAEFVTLFRGGEPLRVLSGIVTAPLSLVGLNEGNFGLDGQPATERALGTGAASADHPENLFALRDAERYLYRSLTAPLELEQKHYLALHVLAVGHVAHLLEDVGNPAHTRNDFLIDHIYYRNHDLEARGKATGAIRFIESLGAGGGFNSRPASFVNDTAVVQRLAAEGRTLPLAYSPTLPSQDTADFDLIDFWQPALRDDLSAPEGFGLAEISNSEFFSGGSVSIQYAAPGRPDCPRDPDAPFESTPVGGVVRALLPEREGMPLDGVSDRPVDSSTPLAIFYSSPLVPHLARCRYHALPRRQTQIQDSDPRWAATAIDESVQRDYLEIVLPLTVDYTAKFFQHYFQQRIELVPLPSGQFKLRNLMRLPFEADASAVQVAFDTKDGGRLTLDVDCGTGTLRLPPNLDSDSDATSDEICTLPATLPEADPNSPKDRGDFWVIIRGRLGSRGTASAFAEDWKEGDYVTAFARSTNEVIYEALPPPFGAPGLLPEDWDALEQADFYRSRVELSGTLDPNSAATPAENLTAHLRVSALDDFRTPVISPTSGRIALMTDVGVDPLDQDYLTTTVPELPGVLIPANPLGVRAFAGIIEPGEDSAETTLRVLGNHAFDVGPLPVWLVGEESFFAMRSTGSIDLALYDAESGEEQPHPIPGNFPVTGNAASLIVAEGENPAFGCALSGQEMLAAKNDQSRGRLFAARVSCVQTTVGEGGSESYGRSIFGRQVVLFDAAGQPIEALMIDANNPLAFEVRPCPGGCDFDGFVAPVVEHASFSPSLNKLAVVVRSAGAHRIFMYDYGTRQLTRIAESQECVHAWVTWAPGDEHLAYFANGGAPCAATAAQLHVTKADGSETTGRAVTNFKGGWRRENPSWWSPLRLPAGPP
jgi:hypothetical protein